jgi:hypothetical protein
MIPSSIAPLILGLCVFLLFILIFRWVGAWMLRINDVISLQKEILAELKKLNIDD